jgi:EpsI family protein
MLARSLIVALLIGAAGVFAGRSAGAEAPVSRRALDSLPLQLDGWHGADASPFPDDVVAQLGVDDYIHRVYRGATGAQVGAYIGYYNSQRQGDAIHSPQNCLPGAGWRPIESGTHTIGDGSTHATVNRYVIAKGLDRQVVLYWYQGRGRIVANEYTNKALLMLDAARIRRTNGGLVRLIAPVSTTPTASTAELTAFAAALLPLLSDYLP